MSNIPGVSCDDSFRCSLTHSSPDEEPYAATTMPPQMSFGLQVLARPLSPRFPSFAIASISTLKELLFSSHSSSRTASIGICRDCDSENLADMSPYSGDGGDQCESKKPPGYTRP